MTVAGTAITLQTQGWTENNLCTNYKCVSFQRFTFIPICCFVRSRAQVIWPQKRLQWTWSRRSIINMLFIHLQRQRVIAWTVNCMTTVFLFTYNDPYAVDHFNALESSVWISLPNPSINDLWTCQINYLMIYRSLH